MVWRPTSSCWTARVILDSVDSSRRCRGVYRWMRRVFFVIVDIAFQCWHTDILAFIVSVIWIIGLIFLSYRRILLYLVLYIPTATYATQDRNSQRSALYVYTSTALVVNCYLLVFVFYFLVFNYILCQSRFIVVGI